MKIISKVLLTEEEEKIVEQAKNLYDALSHSTLKECKGGLNEYCDNCPLCVGEYKDTTCVIDDLSYALLKFIKGVK